MKLFFALVVLASLCLHAAADVSWGLDEERNIQIITNDADRFEIRAVRANKADKTADAIAFIFTHIPLPRFILRYFEHDPDGSALFGIRWHILKAIEFNDTDGIDGISAGDQIIKTYPFWAHSVTGTEWGIGFGVRGVDGNDVFYVCANFDGQTPRPDIRICAYFSPRQVLDNGTVVHPAAAKWGITFSNIPYTYSNTKFALKVGIDTNEIVRVMNATDPDAGTDDPVGLTIATGNIGARCLATWLSNVTLAGGHSCPPTAPVVRSVVYSTQTTWDFDNWTNPTDPEVTSFTHTTQIVYYTFDTTCQPTWVHWDPELGIATSSGSFPVPSFAVVLLMALWLLFSI